jgi:hypothetical protein
VTKDSHFTKHSDQYDKATLIHLFWRRVDHLETCESMGAPKSVLDNQKDLVRQIRRILHNRGIEYPSRPRPPIKNKHQASKLFGQGSFGNYCRQWENAQDVIDSGYKGLLVLRTRGSGGGGDTIYDLTVDQASNIVKHGYKKLTDSIADLNRVPFQHGVNYFNEQLNDDYKRVIIQGEICRLSVGLVFKYSTVNTKMKPAMQKYSREARGVKAFSLLSLCCADGYECIMDLLTEYPDHVIEFTVFNRACGVRGWRTIVWEVRSY